MPEQEKKDPSKPANIPQDQAAREAAEKAAREAEEEKAKKNGSPSEALVFYNGESNLKKEFDGKKQEELEDFIKKFANEIRLPSKCLTVGQPTEIQGSDGKPTGTVVVPHMNAKGKPAVNETIFSDGTVKFEFIKKNIGPKTITIPRKGLNGPDESLGFDVLEFDKDGKLVGFVSAGKGHSQLNTGWLQEQGVSKDIVNKLKAGQQVKFISGATITDGIGKENEPEKVVDVDEPEAEPEKKAAKAQPAKDTEPKQNTEKTSKKQKTKTAVEKAQDGVDQAKKKLADVEKDIKDGKNPKIKELETSIKEAKEEYQKNKDSLERFEEEQKKASKAGKNTVELDQKIQEMTEKTNNAIKKLDDAEKACDKLKNELLKKPREVLKSKEETLKQAKEKEQREIEKQKKKENAKTPLQKKQEALKSKKKNLQEEEKKLSDLEKKSKKVKNNKNLANSVQATKHNIKVLQSEVKELESEGVRLERDNKVKNTHDTPLPPVSFVQKASNTFSTVKTYLVAGYNKAKDHLINIGVNKEPAKNQDQAPSQAQSMRDRLSVNQQVQNDGQQRPSGAPAATPAGQNRGSQHHR